MSPSVVAISALSPSPSGAAAPAADVGLGQHEQLVRLGVATDDVRAAEARVAAGAEPVGADRRERLPEQVVGERCALVVPARRRGRLGAEHGARRDRQREGSKKPSFDRACGRGDRADDRLARREQRAGRAVHRARGLRRAAREVGMDPVVADRHRHDDRQRVLGDPSPSITSSAGRRRSGCAASSARAICSPCSSTRSNAASTSSDAVARAGFDDPLLADRHRGDARVEVAECPSAAAGRWPRSARRSPRSARPPS